MMDSKPEIIAGPDIAKNQMRAGNPDHSVWVSANAGSGKTHILTKRVLRLLLSGVEPQNIVCLTYTKAAAAEMKSRIGRDLGQWALMNDERLKEELRQISGRTPTEREIRRARTLFALALETPGGLKINTIHGFCEAALHRFPLEAGVPVNFSVIEDRERDDMIERARKRILASGLDENGKIGEAVATLFASMGDDTINKTIRSAMGQGRRLRHVLADTRTAKNNLRQVLNVTKNLSIEQLKEKIVNESLLDRQSFEQVLKVLEPAPPNARKKRLADLLGQMKFDARTAKDMQGAFLTNGLKPRRALMLKAEKERFPELSEMLEAERDRIFELSNQIRKVELLERSQALLDVLSAIHKSYEEAKRASEKLDFDDLISHFETLLSTGTSAEWVRYKMDAAMAHILVDESQDTNPDQWRVIKLLVEEFFAGESSATINRTIFGVGDEKQSIFGFQGAEPRLFNLTGGELRQKARQAGKKFEEISFLASFRTLPNILEAVDMLCRRDDIADALLAARSRVRHESARADKGGTITFWPPPEEKKSDSGRGGWLDKPEVSMKSRERHCAERIGRQIRCWLDEKRPLGKRQRPVCAEDILILVQSRKTLFTEIIRALKSNKIPTPGADRLFVNSHIAIRDLRALGEILLNPGDDLTLAALLRSPLFEISEAQLETLCLGRGNKISLWPALKKAASQHEWAARAYEELAEMRSKLDFERPYEFFSTVLFANRGLKKFHGRLGGEIDEVIDEFLNLALEYEQAEQPSLQGFLRMLGEREIEIKRELSERGGGVRVMSVHGAKGLEAPIVILADATKKQPFTKNIFLGDEKKPLLIHGGKDQHPDETMSSFYQVSKNEEMAEYWRKLYVAMTRAEDELYITGIKFKADDQKNKEKPQNWYGAVLDALDGKTRKEKIRGEDEMAICFPASPPEMLPVKEPDGNKRESRGDDPAKNTKIVPARKPLIIRPSTADADMLEKLKEGQADEKQLHETGHGEFSDYPPNGDTDRKRKSGTALHYLLEHLAPLPGEKRKKAGLNALARILCDQAEDHQDILEQALGILEGEHSQRLFGKNSRAELPIFVHGKKDRSPITIIGRIDRIIIEDDRVLLVDFKSGSNVPRSQEQVSRQYLVQMGLYLRCGKRLFPDHEVMAAIYWTGNNRLMMLQNQLLLSATSEFNMN